MSFEMEELIKLKEINQELYQKNVQTALIEKRQEFLDEFEDYFRERGFVIRKRNGSVSASFDTLHFKAFSDETGKLMIMKGKEEIANIYIHFDGDTDLSTIRNQLNKQDIQHEMEIEKSLTLKLEIPTFYFTGSNFDIKFESPLSILENIFHV